VRDGGSVENSLLDSINTNSDTNSELEQYHDEEYGEEEYDEEYDEEEYGEEEQDEEHEEQQQQQKLDGGGGQNGFRLRNLTARELARNLTLLEQRQFLAIQPAEFWHIVRYASKKATLAPHVLANIAWFNQVHYARASEIIVCVDVLLSGIGLTRMLLSLHATS